MPNFLENKVGQQVFFLNLEGRGYSTFSYKNNKQLLQHPLGIENEFITRDVLRIHQHFDKFFARNIAPLSLCLINSGDFVYLAYGLCLYDAPDEMGRKGLNFVHTIQLTHQSHLYEAVAVLMCMLSRVGIARISEAVAALAVNSRGFEAQLASIASKYNTSLKLKSISQIKADISSGVSLGHFFSRIEHDCAGASTIAWLTYAKLYEDLEGPWAILDKVANNGVVYTTEQTRNKSASHLSASKIIEESIELWVDNQLLDKRIDEHFDREVLRNSSVIDKESSSEELTGLNSRNELEQEDSYLNSALSVSDVKELESSLENVVEQTADDGMDSDNIEKSEYRDTPLSDIGDQKKKRYFGWLAGLLGRKDDEGSLNHIDEEDYEQQKGQVINISFKALVLSILCVVFAYFLLIL